MCLPGRKACIVDWLGMAFGPSGQISAPPQRQKNFGVGHRQLVLPPVTKVLPEVRIAWERLPRREACTPGWRDGAFPTASEQVGRARVLHPGACRNLGADRPLWMVLSSFRWGGARHGVSPQAGRRACPAGWWGIAWWSLRRLLLLPPPGKKII